MTGAYKNRNKFFKLLKNDFLASSRVISLFYIAEAILFGIYGIGTALSKIETFSPEVLDKLGSLRSASVAFIAIVSFLLIFVTLFFVIFDFFKSLFGAQGYLSFTLPVSSYELLGSKVIIYGGWFIVSCALFVYSFFFGMDYLFSLIQPGYIPLAEELMTGILNLPSLKQLFIAAVYLVVMFCITVFNFIFISYFAISVAHIRLLQKFSLLASIPIFVAVSIIFAVVTYLLSKWIDFSLVLTNNYDFYFGWVDPNNVPLIELGYMPLPMTPVFVFAALDAVMFVLAAFVMHKKVNLK